MNALQCHVSEATEVLLFGIFGGLSVNIAYLLAYLNLF